MAGSDMTPQDQHRIQAWLTGLDREVDIRLVATDDPRTERLRNFCRTLTDMGDAVRLRVERGEGAPGIGVGAGLIYRAVPAGPELPPFLEAVAGAHPFPAADVREQLAQIRASVFLSLYVAEACPFCPTVVRQLVPLAVETDRIRLTVIDAGLFPELAAADNVRSVPALILNDRFRWTGAVPLAELLSLMTRQDPAEMGPRAMETLVGEGRAHDLARMMADEGRVFPALISLIAHEKWAVRLGAMVCAESLAELNPRVARELSPLIRDRYAEAADSVKGDLLYAAGVAGGPEARALLTSVLQAAADPSLTEAAQEAMDMLPP